MPKLTNQEIKAVANKLHKLLEEKARLEKLRAIHEYIPSPVYQKFETLSKEFQDTLKQQEDLKKKVEDITSSMSSILEGYNIEYRLYNLYDKKYLKQYCNEIIQAEAGIMTVPSIEDLKNEITIAGIDESFNVDSYINSELDKFN